MQLLLNGDSQAAKLLDSLSVPSTELWEVNGQGLLNGDGEGLAEWRSSIMENKGGDQEVKIENPDNLLECEESIASEVHDIKEVVKRERSHTTEAEPLQLHINSDNSIHNELNKDDEVIAHLEEGEMKQKPLIKRKSIVKNRIRHEKVSDPIQRKMLKRNVLMSIDKLDMEEEMGEKKRDFREITKRIMISKAPPKSIMCPECGESFQSNHLKPKYCDLLSIFSKHQQKHEVVNFSCDCPNVPGQVVWSNQIRLGTDFYKKLRHIKMDHQGWFGCAKCLKCFSTEDKLSFHMKRHSKEYKCDKCDKPFEQRSRLNDHIAQKHEAPMNCPDCGKTILSGRTFEDHVGKVHTRQPCPKCSVMILKRNMNGHIRNYHNEDKDKKFYCSECNRGFMERIRFDAHNMNVHIKSRPFECRYGCEVRYNDLSNRNSHEKKKHGGLYASYR